MNDLVTFQNLGSFDRIELSALSARGCPTDDLDHHAGLYKGIELKLMQLGEGAFEGPAVSGFFGKNLDPPVRLQAVRRAIPGCRYEQVRLLRQPI